MHDEGMHDHWILPLEGLNTSTVHHSHSPGESLKLMNLYDNLLKDWTDALKEHALFTTSLDDDDPLKFSRFTPKHVSTSMRGLWDGGSPSSDRIVHDARKVACTNMPIIKEHIGTLLPNLGNRIGDRCPNKLIKPKHWGGSRERKHISKHKKRHAHPDAVDTRTSIVTTDVQVRSAEFDVKVEAKTEVKSDDIEGKKV